MGRQSSDQTVLHCSSIALLQERFRQLQRVKKMREERELQRKFFAASESARCKQPTWFFHPELIRPSQPLPAPPSLQLKPVGNCMDLQELDTSFCIGLWQNWPTKYKHGLENLHGTEVDTTLHL